jgi:hypothetical protein
VSVTYNFVREILSLAVEERSRIKALAQAGYAPDSVVVRSVMAPPTSQDVIAEITRPAGEGAGPFAHRQRTGVFRTIRMPVFDRFTAARREALPAGYLVPVQYSDLVELLQGEGIVVERLRGGWRGEAEAFTIDSIVTARGPFEGHRTVSLDGHWSPARDSASAGGYYVSTSQRLGELAAYLLEPASEDGLVTWNFLDRSLRIHSFYPIRRVRQPLNVPRDILTH